MASSQELLDRLELFGTRLGLDRTRRLLAALERPQERMSIVLVAGTNGKGSTAALLSSMAIAAGYRTGLYTSPHLETVHERVRVDGFAISEAQLAAGLESVVAAAREIGEGECTYFEALTCAALVQFAAEGVELAVLEVGLGGRLDATNATEPVLSVISEIALDHREHLGETVDRVALEKAGILRKGRPAVAWVSDPAAARALRGRANDLGAPLRSARDNCAIEPTGTGQSVVITTSGGRYELEPPLAGAHQLANLALAVSAAETLAGAGWAGLHAAAIERGGAACRWPGRLEWVETDATGRVLLDTAHNPHACAALAEYLIFLERGYTLVFGALEGKDVAGMLPPVAERAGHILLTTPSSPRGIAAGELTRHLAEPMGEIVPQAPDALTQALATTGPTVITGSHHLVGELRGELTRRFGTPRPAASLRIGGDP